MKARYRDWFALGVYYVGRAIWNTAILVKIEYRELRNLP